MKDYGFYQSIIDNLEQINSTQGENIEKAGRMMAQAIS